MIDGLTFEAEGHVYRYRGCVVPSVTKILEPLQHLQGIPWEVLGAAAEFGTHVHQACHLYNQHDLDEESLDPALAPYLNSYKLFLAETGFVVVHSEILVYSELMRYAGQLDFTGTWRNTSWVVDIKSGIVPSTVGAQTAAYQNALPASDRPKKRACLQLSGTGYKFIEQKEPSDFSLFTSALNCYRFNEKHHPRKEHANRRTNEYA